MLWILIVSLFSVLITACSDSRSEESRMPPGASGRESKEIVFTDNDQGVGFEREAAPAMPNPVEEKIPADSPAASVNQKSAESPVSSEAKAPVNLANADRVIVRSAKIDMEVENVTSALDTIGAIASSTGGWVVSSDQTLSFIGSISIRVPAEKLDSVLDQIRSLASKIRTSTTTSQDLTEEFTDVSARAQTLRDTKNVLTGLFDRAETVEEALEIQKEITRVQGDLEALEARINFISESAAYSLITVSLQASPVLMVVDGGPDIAVGAINTGVPFESSGMERPSIFRARFTPPKEIEDFTVTWDFGDGSPLESTNRVAPTTTEGELISASVVHNFFRDEDSPFIVTVKVTGSGDAGLAEGEDTLIVTVSRIPPIVVFAGEEQTVEANRNVELTGSFTVPESITGVKYKWDFGDGSAPVEQDLGDVFGAGNVSTEHVFHNFRWNPYEVRLTVSGGSEIGEIEGVATTYIFVEETVGVTAPELNAGSTIRNAGRALEAIGVISVKVLLWIAILSPAWIAVGLIIVFIRKRSTKKAISLRWPKWLRRKK